MLRNVWSVPLAYIVGPLLALFPVHFTLEHFFSVNHSNDSLLALFLVIYSLASSSTAFDSSRSSFSSVPTVAGVSSFTFSRGSGRDPASRFTSATNKPKNFRCRLHEIRFARRNAGVTSSSFKIQAACVTFTLLIFKSNL